MISRNTKLENSTTLESQEDDAKIEETNITCPISGAIFNDPITLPSGHDVERGTAVNLKRNPFTQEPFTYSDSMKSNFTLKAIVEHHLKKYPEAKTRQYVYDNTTVTKKNVIPSATNSSTTNVSHANLSDSQSELDIADAPPSSANAASNSTNTNRVIIAKLVDKKASLRKELDEMVPDDKCNPNYEYNCQDFKRFSLWPTACGAGPVGMTSGAFIANTGAGVGYGAAVGGTLGCAIGTGILLFQHRTRARLQNEIESISQEIEVLQRLAQAPTIANASGSLYNNR
jgi:hypothetical protein